MSVEIKLTPIATAGATLIAGLLLGAWLMLASAPAKAQSGDVLYLLSLKASDLTNDEADGADEPYIKVDGSQRWSANGNGSGKSMQDEEIRNLATESAPVTLVKAGADVQLWERDPGFFNSPDDFIGEFSAEYTDGTQKTHTFTRDGAVYVLEYKVLRPDRTPPPRRQ